MLVWDRLTNGDRVSVDDDVDASDYSQYRPSPNSQFYDDVYRQCSRERKRYQESSKSRGGSRRSHFHDNDPVSNPMQQRKWFKQAELDLAAAEHFMKSTEEVQAYNWICYMSHQAVEKSLMSMMYRRDANSVNNGHDIYGIAASLGDDSLMSATGEMQSLLGNYTHLRYPDEHAAGRIPSSSVTRAMAETAFGIARRILDKVDAKN
ncbi:hypothetical protein KP79_PYT00738 [Mizuhopecten yessoensis]|uniref:HEPN domain-containing protein n=1 Tax=Mizuhopecten yessoensis TaxID=6573 RepID=A0A210QRG5_MIZYE|nr:hypothetical protein KP79_PYT00738 [Mizuhopecten yessoensis]